MRRGRRGCGGRAPGVTVIIRVGWPAAAGAGAWQAAQSETGVWIVAIILGLVAVALAWRTVRDA